MIYKQRQGREIAVGKIAKVHKKQMNFVFITVSKVELEFGKSKGEMIAMSLTKNYSEQMRVSNEVHANLV